MEDSTMTRSIRSGLLVSACCLLIAISGQVFAEGGARVSGKIVVEDGTAPTELTIILRPTGTAGVETSVTPSKKGRFTIASLHPGTYSVVVEPNGYTVTRFKMRGRSPSGQPYGDPVDELLAPGASSPSFTVIDLLRLSLELTLDKIDTGAAGEGIAIEKARDDSPKLEELNDLLQEQEWDKLIERAEALLAEDPALGGAQYMLAIGHWQAGDLEAADVAMLGALELSPDQPAIHKTYGDLLTKRGNALTAAGTDGAEAVFLRALEQLDLDLAENPLDLTSLINKVITLDALHRPEETIAVLDLLLEINPDDMRTYLHKAELLTELGRTERTEEALAVIGAMPVNSKAAADVLYNIAVDIYDAGRNLEAVAAVEKAIEADPDQPLFWRLKGRALIAVGKDTPGVEALKQYLSMVPADDPAAEADRALVEALGGAS
jgi:tetratricopeptide (TPR) repeat protein